MATVEDMRKHHVSNISEVSRSPIESVLFESTTCLPIPLVRNFVVVAGLWQRLGSPAEGTDFCTNAIQEAHGFL